MIPAAIVAAGGAIDHFGMPVDPGNLLLLGHVGGKPVLGLPGCARSPKVNGFDWVLERLVAGLPVGPREIMRWAPAGCSPRSRSAGCRAPKPAPRRGRQTRGRKGAAGPAHRRAAARRRPIEPHGRSNKMLEEIDGRPMVARTAQRLLSSRARPIIAVLGNMADEVDAALGKLPVERVRNPDFADGLSTSLKRGLAALPRRYRRRRSSASATCR